MTDFHEQPALAGEMSLGTGWVRRRRSPLAAAALFGCMLLLFFLPFISVSREQAETESLTGVELLSGEEPLIHGSPSAAEAKDMRQSVDKHVKGARLLFAVIVAALLVTILSSTITESIEAPYVMLVSALGVLGGIFAFFGADFHPLGGGADRLYEPAFALVSLLAIIQVIFGYTMLVQRWEGKRSGSALDIWLIAATVLGVLLTFVYGIGLLLAIAVLVLSVIGLRTSPNLFRLAASVAALAPLAFVLGAVM